MLLTIIAILFCALILYLVLLAGVLFRPRFWSNTRWQAVTKLLTSITILSVGSWLVLVVTHRIFPQRTGVFALTQVLAPYLIAPALLFIPLVFVRGAAIIRWALLEQH